MTNIRPKDLPRVTAPTAGDAVILDGATARSITVENLYLATIASDAELAALAGLVSAADQLPYFTGSGTAALASFPAFARLLLAGTSQAAVRTTLALTPGTDVQPQDADLSALAANSGTGLWSITGAGTGSVRTITGPAAGITVTNGGGVAGNPTLALANDLAALEGLASTGIARRTATDTWTVGGAVTNAEHATMAALTLKGNATGSAAIPADIDVTALPLKASPGSTDIVLIHDAAASGAFKKTTVGALSSAGSVASIAGNTGAFTLSTGLTNVGNDIRLAFNTQIIQSTGGTALNPTSTISTTPVMMGLGSTIKITPASSPRVRITISGLLTNNQANGQVFTQVRFGTGTAPANGVAVTGTQIGTSKNTLSAAANQSMVWTGTGIISGLTVGTPIWFDVALSAGNVAGSGAFLQMVDYTIEEV